MRTPVPGSRADKQHELPQTTRNGTERDKSGGTEHQTEMKLESKLCRFLKYHPPSERGTLPFYEASVEGIVTNLASIDSTTRDK